MPLHLTGELASLIILTLWSSVFLSPPALFLQPSSGHSFPNIVNNFNWPFGSTILSSPSFPYQWALRSCLKKDSTSSFPTKGLVLIQPSCLPFNKICSGFGIQDSPQSIPDQMSYPFFSLSPSNHTHLLTVHHTCRKHSCPWIFINIIALARNTCSTYSPSSIIRGWAQVPPSWWNLSVNKSPPYLSDFHHWAQIAWCHCGLLNGYLSSLPSWISGCFLARD